MTLLKGRILTNEVLRDKTADFAMVLYRSWLVFSEINSEYKFPVVLDIPKYSVIGCQTDPFIYSHQMISVVLSLLWVLWIHITARPVLRKWPQNLQYSITFKVSVIWHCKCMILPVLCLCPMNPAESIDIIDPLLLVLYPPTSNPWSSCPSAPCAV